MKFRTGRRSVPAVFVVAMIAASAVACGDPTDSPTSAPSDTPHRIEGFTPVVRTPEFEFLSFTEIETLIGFEVLRADLNKYRYEPLNREIVTNGDTRYYEVYSRLTGSDQMTTVSLKQKPVPASNSLGPLVDFEGWESQVESTGGRFEVRFLTGAVTADGQPIEARVAGPTEEAVRQLVSTLTFE